MNQMLRRMGDGNVGIAAYTLILSIGNAANCITTGIGGVSLTLCGIFFHEEDRSALRETVKLLCRSGIVLGFLMGVILLIFAPAMIGLFIPEADRTQAAAILGLRLFGAGLIPCCINNALKYAYQGTGRNGLTVTISLLEGTVFPILAAFVLSRFIHATGAWLGFAVGEILMLLAAGLLLLRKTGKKPWEDDAFLLLKRDFGAAKDQTLEMNITSMEEVAAAAQSAEQFCMERGQDERISKHISLCIEEMAGNVISHGFADDKGHHLSVRLLNKEDRWVLRFRDDCRAFDPVHYVPAEGQESLGIRLVLALAEEANYTYSLNLNNLTLRLRPDAQSGE
jgi:anti-sigma regulatory factor (Ser/Thr protein kinase)